MATWDEIVSDKTTYPDSVTVKLADGVEIPLGQLRSSSMKDADYRRKTAELARQKEDMERQWNDRVTALQEGEAHLVNLARDLMSRNPGMTRQEAVEEVSTDPAVAKLRGELAEIKKVMEPMARALTEMDNRWKESQRAFVVAQHRQKLAELKQKDPDLDEMELASWAKENLTPRLDVAYLAKNHEKLVQKAVAEAREKALTEGYERGKTEALMPPALPIHGADVKADPNAIRPKDLTEAVNLASRDPEIMGIFAGRV